MHLHTHVQVSDLPAMRLARLPIAIGDDPKLREIAISLGMEVLPLAAATVCMCTLLMHPIHPSYTCILCMHML